MGVKIETQDQRLDAGLRSLDHYRSRLPYWRFVLREWFIPYLRWETPYVAKVQQLCRTPTLDSYFAYTANLGTHTFFMVMLPIFFYCGHVQSGRAMVHVLAGGVYFSGFMKDLLCLPRPLSPPLHRISRSASTALEYGWPSTHSTNALSVVFYAIHAIKATSGVPSMTSSLIQTLLYLYATSIVVGRVYCGMHGFIDVVCGSLLGIALAVVQNQHGSAFDLWITSGAVSNLLITTIIVLILIRIHPEPADDCPCFDDSVSFAGVFIGVQLGAWQPLHILSGLQKALPSDGTFSMQELGTLKAVLRIVLGVLVVFLWRGVMKPTLLKVLPPIFRVVEKLGLSLPRRFHLQASQYKKVPDMRKDDDIIPPVLDIPSMITSLRYPRKRTISIGAQSQADAYEAMAYREHQRRRSLSTSPKPNRRSGRDEHAVYLAKDRSSGFEGIDRSAKQDSLPNGTNVLKPRDSRNIASNEDAILMSPTEEDPDDAFTSVGMTATSQLRRDDDVADKEMFRKLQVPRVRYDVEVITKLVVYSGIGWLATEVNPMLFDLLGLGVYHLSE